MATRKFIRQGDQQDSIIQSPGLYHSGFNHSRIQDYSRSSNSILHHSTSSPLARHHRVPRRPGRRRAPTPEELRQATVTPASKLYGPPRVHFSAPLDHLTKTAKIRGATGTYSTIPHPARCRNLAKPLLYQDPINLVLSPHLCVFHSHSAPYPENCL
jgi:hypothetical protein